MNYQYNDPIALIVHLFLTVVNNAILYEIDIHRFF